MYIDSGKKFIEITFLSNFKLKFEEIIIFFKFCPRFARTRVFSRHIFPAYFVGFFNLFFFAAFLYFFYYFTKTKAYSVCAIEL